MDEQNIEKRPSNPRRRKRSQLQIIKEDYLPVIIAAICVILVIWFIIGSIVRAVQNRKYDQEQAANASIAAQEAQKQLEDEAAALLAEAAQLANQYDYNGAIATLDSFTGDMYAFAELSEKYTEYAKLAASLILWDDPSKVVNLSFQPLIAEAERTFADKTYGTSYYNNYITANEFGKILLQLYENGYILVRYSDIINEDGTTSLYLPNGKKPLIITETHVNYNTYMVDGDGDKLPDKDGAGFANKLILDENGNLTCEMVDSTGKIVTGAYDIVPILESFIQTHPDFSYRGAKAVLALTGYDGLFGYRTSASAKEYFGKAYYDQQVEEAKQVIEAVKKAGYELACYSYENEPYGSYTADQIKAELETWKSDVTPLLGDISLFVMCRNSDIAENGTAYSGDKFNVLKSFGFTDFIGFSTDGKSWFNAYSDHNRMGRVLVTGSNLQSHAEWFEGIFDAYSVKDKARN